MKVFRSIIKRYFPVELLVNLDEVSRQHDIDNNNKTKEVVSMLKSYKVPFETLGNGTNRYGILVDGCAVKIGLDRAGKIDNKREFKYSRALYPSVIKVYDCATTGLISSSEYINLFSLDDYHNEANQREMRRILKEISQYFLIGDIGVTTQNYVNWGIRNNGSLAILDFAYIYSLSYKGFKCTCEDEPMLQFDNDYVYLICPVCGKKFSFSDIRRRISKQDEINEIGDITKIGYVLHKDGEMLPINPEFSPKIKEDKPKKKKKRIILPDTSHIYDIDAKSQMDALKEINQLLKG